MPVLLGCYLTAMSGIGYSVNVDGCGALKLSAATVSRDYWYQLHYRASLGISMAEAK